MLKNQGGFKVSFYCMTESEKSSEGLPRYILNQVCEAALSKAWVLLPKSRLDNQAVIRHFNSTCSCDKKFAFDFHLEIKPDVECNPKYIVYFVYSNNSYHFVFINLMA